MNQSVNLINALAALIMSYNGLLGVMGTDTKYATKARKLQDCMTTARGELVKAVKSFNRRRSIKK